MEPMEAVVQHGVNAGPARERPVLPVRQSEHGVVLDPVESRKIGEALAAEYSFAEPFPHIVLDNFLPEPVIRMALDHFPAQRLKSDIVFEGGYAGQHKRQILPSDCDSTAQSLFHFFNSQPMLQFLEGLSSIDGLIPDPYFSGGGYHEIARGGKLGIHADFRLNDRLSLQRRMNVIIYLNEGWQVDYGGCLELWDRKMTACVRSVLPVFNRCVIFNTDADSYHGHPDPLNCPGDVRRRSIALYYYTASRRIFEEVPDMGTLYQARPGEGKVAKREARWLKADQYMRQWLPPAMLRWAHALRRRLGA